MFCGLFFRFSSFPFLNHLNLREEYSELVSQRSTSLEPAADSWLFISFSRGGKAGLGPPSAGAGFLPEPRSFFLPFPLPLPSLRSDISPEKCALCAGGSGAKAMRDKFGPGAWEKFVPRGAERLLSPADAACGPGHLGPAIAPSGVRPRALGAAPVSQGRHGSPLRRVPAAVGSLSWPLPGALAAPRREKAFTVPPVLASPGPSPCAAPLRDRKSVV